VDPFASYNSIENHAREVIRDASPTAPIPSSNALQATATDSSAEKPTLLQAGDDWNEQFARTLQEQHARIREFLQARSDRWQEAAARCMRQIETLQAQVAALMAANENLREKADYAGNSESQAESDEASSRYALAIDEIRELKAHNAELQQQLQTASSGPRRSSASAAADSGGDWESQKRRLLAELESEDGKDVGAIDRRREIEAIIERTDRIIAEKDREIEELKHLLDSQSGSLGSLAVGAAALEQVFDQDAIIREERQRLKQSQEESREKLRQAEIEIAMERARLARREAEIEDRFRNMEPRPGTSAAESEALAATGRAVRGRWRTQLGLSDDEPAEGGRGRR